MYAVKISGRTRASKDERWKPVICFVRYRDATSHRAIVESSFRDHLQLSSAEIAEYPSHLAEPVNVARAILLYRWFRERWLFFEDMSFEIVALASLPEEQPDAEDSSYALWVKEG